MRITHLPALSPFARGPFMAQAAPSPAAQAQDLAEALRRDGAIVNVQISAPAALAAQAGAAAKPQVVKGLVDTGASISTVSDAVAQAAGLQAVGSVPLYGVGGGGERPIYAASFGLQDYGVVVDPIEIAGVTIPMPGVDILVGRDILKALRLDYKGPAGAFTLTQEEGTPLERAGAAAAATAGEKPSTTTWIAVGGGLAAIATLGALFALDVI